MKITANDLRVENGAKIASETFGQGNAGDTILNVNNLIISNGGLIRTGTFGAGNGGEVLINNANSVEVNASQTILGSNFKSSLLNAAIKA